MEETPERALVVIPHPGNAEFWCGGTVSQWIKLGASVHFLLCTDGGRGSHELDERDLAQVREAEQDSAAGILGVTELVMLHRPDGELEDTHDFRKEIVRQIRRVRPQVVICPEPYRKNLAWHRDYRIAGQVTMDAVFPYARDHLHFQDLWEQGGLEPHKTGTVLLWGAELADTYVDVSDSMDLKLKALLAHRSRFAGNSKSEVEKLVKQLAGDAAADQAFEYAEAFRKVTFHT